MSAKSSRPETGWYISRNENTDYIIVVSGPRSVWISTSTEIPHIYYYELDDDAEPEWDTFNLEALNDDSSS